MVTPSASLREEQGITQGPLLFFLLSFFFLSIFLSILRSFFLSFHTCIATHTNSLANKHVDPGCFKSCTYCTTGAESASLQGADYGRSSCPL